MHRLDCRLDRLRVDVAIVLFAAVTVGCMWCCGRVEAQDPKGPPVFIRGDINSNGQVTPVDATFLLRFLFLGLGTITCDDAADVDDDGMLGLTDSIRILNYIFLDGAAPSAPFPAAGVDPTPDPIGCAVPTVTPPTLDLAYAMEWDEDVEVFQGQEGIEIFLLATTTAPTECFSIAYEMDRGVVADVTVDFEDTVLPEVERMEFETSGLFNVVRTVIDADRELLQIGATFEKNTEMGFDVIPFAATQRALTAERLVRLELDIKTDATLGDDVVILRPVAAVDLPPGNRFFNEYCRTTAGGGGGGVEAVNPKADPGDIKVIGGEEFLRGDVNGDEFMNITDVMFAPQWLFGTGPQPACLEAADVNGDADLDVSDSIFLALWLFGGGMPPAPPFNPELVCQSSITFLGCDAACGG